MLSLLGAGGLLGSAVRRIASTTDLELEPFTGLPWSEPERAAQLISTRHTELMSAEANPGVTWVVMWCAGGGNVGADTSAMAAETRLVELLTASVRKLADRFEIPTALSFASSAGAVWSGSDERVLSEDSPPEPWHPYGRAKLRQETIVEDGVRGSRWVRARLARISNLYGPEPAGRSPSGLPGHLVSNALQHRPTAIYVPMDTQRDYVYVDHAANTMFRDAIDGFDLPGGTSHTDLIAAGYSHTIASVAATLERVLTRHVPLTVGFSRLASRQPRILSFRSIERDLGRMNPTNLDIGLKRLVSARLGSQPHRTS